jgi:predicted phage terminase large subunit-like protein
MKMANEFLNDPMQMSPEQILLTARTSLECFSYAVMPGFEAPQHVKLMIFKIEQLLRGRIRRLAIVAPPRHGKSNLSSVLLPAYFLGRNPTESVITASYSGELSETWGRKVRNIVGSPLFGSIFPNCRMSPDSAAAHRFSTTRGGEYNALGTGGAMTGKGASLLILDDLIRDSDEARSEVTCTSIIEWLQSTALTRLTASGKVLAIATRWSERDPMGFLLRQRGWEVLHLPAVSNGDGDALDRPAGTPLWESRFPLPVLQSIREAVGANVWNCLYQGDPIAAQGSVFKRSWLKHYAEAPTKFKKIVQSWDTAFKAGATNDFSVCSTWGVTETHFYLLDLWRNRVEFPALKRAFVEQAERWCPSEILIEDKSSGQSLIQELKTSTNFPVIPIKVDSDKTSRASAVTGFFESGRVLFPKEAEWLQTVEDELCAFPRGAHDDCVDSISQALNRLRTATERYGVLEWFAGIAKGLFKSADVTEQTPETVREKRRRDALEHQAVVRGLTHVPQPPRVAFDGQQPPPCPSCASTCVIRLGNADHCNSCGKDVYPPGREPMALIATRDQGIVLRRVKHD